MKVPVTKTTRIIGLVLLLLTFVAALNNIINWPPLWAVSVIFAVDALGLIYYSVFCFKHKCTTAGIASIFVILGILAFLVLYFLN